MSSYSKIFLFPGLIQIFSRKLSKRGFQVNIQVEEITLNKIKKELKEGKILLLRVNAKHLRNGKKNTSNYIVVHAYDGNYFSIVDPCFGALSIPEHIMEKSFHTLETKKYRDHRMIVF